MFDRSKLESLCDVSVTRTGYPLSYVFPQTEMEVTHFMDFTFHCFKKVEPISQNCLLNQLNLPVYLVYYSYQFYHPLFGLFRLFSSHFFMRNSFIRNLSWDSQMTKKLSVLKLRRLRKLQFFLSFLVKFKDTVTNFENDLLRKESRRKFKPVSEGRSGR